MLNMYPVIGSLCGHKWAWVVVNVLARLNGSFIRGIILPTPSYQKPDFTATPFMHRPPVPRHMGNAWV